MREIVTVQVGSFANYIGSHFWNFQDELLGLADDPYGDSVYKNCSLNMDVLYRAGETHQGIATYTPRLISIGSQGSLGSLCSYYSEIPSSGPSDILTWKGKVSRQVSETHKRNLFLESLNEENQGKISISKTGASDGEQKPVEDKDIVGCLENDVHYWTDFSKVHYHPRSLFELYLSWTDVQKFDNFGIGRDVLSDSLQGEEMNDRLRYFVEECDHPQGFQFIVDDSGGFSSIASDLMDSIADDYGKTPVLLYTARDPSSYIDANSQKYSLSRALHDAISFSQLSASCKLIVPLGLPSFNASRISRFLCVDDAKLFHSSAVYAASLHSISLPFRMELLGPTANPEYVSGDVNIGELAEMLAGQARQNIVNILDTTMPAPSLDGKQSPGYFQKSLHPLTPEVAEDVEDVQAVESVVVHGALHSGGGRASISEMKEVIYEAYQYELPRPMFSHFSAALCPLPIPLPFPSIFGNLVGKHGELLTNPIKGSGSRGSLEIVSIPMAARLRSSTAILPFIEKRLGNLRRFGVQRGAPGAQLLRNWGFSKDEVEDMGEVLSKMVMALDPRSESSDSD